MIGKDLSQLEAAVSSGEMAGNVRHQIEGGQGRGRQERAGEGREGM